MASRAEYMRQYRAQKRAKQVRQALSAVERARNPSQKLAAWQAAVLSFHGEGRLARQLEQAYAHAPAGSRLRARLLLEIVQAMS
jgi:hypothetical protein